MHHADPAWQCVILASDTTTFIPQEHGQALQEEQQMDEALPVPLQTFSYVSDIARCQGFLAVAEEDSFQAGQRAV